MATTNLVSAVSLPWPKSNGTSWSITIPAATAGNTLVVGAMGGAIATPTGSWTRGPAYGGGAFDLSLWTRDATGGETTITGTLNGSGDNIVLYAMELPGAFTLTASSNNGSGATLSDTTDFTVSPSASTAAVESLVVGLFAVIQGTAFGESNRFIQSSPAGVHAIDDAEQAAGGATVIAAVTVADVPAGTYAATTQYLGLGPGTAFAAQAIFTRPAGVSVVNWANDTDRANHLIGRRFQGFYNVLPSGVIAGFPTALSVQPGDTLDFKVDSGAGAFTCEIVRLGWNGHDTLGGTKMAQLTGTAVTQPAATVDSVLGSSSMAGWTSNLSWDVPDDAASGLYTAVFTLTSTGQTAATHFVVRPAAVSGKIVCLIPDHTHHAYNLIGAATDTAASVTGRSVYGDGTNETAFNLRAYGYSFDRPYLTGATTGQTYIWDSEYPLIQFLEAQGYDLAYLSDTDLEADVHLLEDAAMVILLGHHEYWTTAIYDAWDNALAAGVNAFAYGANLAGWHVRVDGTDPHLVRCYKTNGSRDVSAGFDGGTGFDPDGLWTGTWRDSASAGGITNDDVRKDITAFGARFVASGPITTAAMAYAASSLPHVRNAAGLAAGKTDGAANLGYELDSADGSAGQPDNLVVLYSTDVAITTGSNDAGTVYSTSETVSATQVLLRHDSGALEWKSAGWRDWWSVTRFRGGSPVSTVDPDIQQYLMNMLYDLGAIPTQVRALRPGEDTTPTDPATGAPTGGRNAVAAAYGLTVPAAGGGSSAGFFALMMP